ncbi:hypothetical protein MEO41_27530 [Dolichospermum sp. ST_sed4]|nr:hypothetical protein [Dolichospermum sp. ST_sed4]
MTAQRADIIIIEGKEYPLFTNPLEDYWTEENPKPPIGWPKTSCWRGYIATWEIIDENLYLTDITIRTPNGEAGLDYVFPNSTGKIKATWYSGELRIPQGDCLELMESVYLTEWHIKVESGEVVSQGYQSNYARSLDNRPWECN